MFNLPYFLQFIKLVQHILPIKIGYIRDEQPKGAFKLQRERSCLDRIIYEILTCQPLAC